MTTIYIPRTIESAEQAEALPAGTIAFDPGADFPSAAVKVHDGGGGWSDTSGIYRTNALMVGWAALDARTAPAP